jgi:hypothetical protein
MYHSIKILNFRVGGQILYKDTYIFIKINYNKNQFNFYKLSYQLFTFS